MFEAPYVFMDCSSLYNVLNESFESAKICDPFYLYLLGKTIEKLILRYSLYMTSTKIFQN